MITRVISVFSHDGATALVRDGKIIAATQLSRLDTISKEGAVFDVIGRRSR